MGDSRKQSLKPWDNLEFGTTALPPATIQKKQSQTDHIEYPQNGESFWEAIRADNAPNGTANEKPQSDVAVEDRTYSISGMDLPRINSAALAASQTEHKMSFRQGLQLFPKAIIWSAVISLAIVGEGFDTSLINSLYAFNTFREAYGVRTFDGSYQITTKWQLSLNNAGAACTILGLLANGWLSERFGYRRTLMYALLAMALFIFLTFFAFNIQTLLAGQILLAIPWGICSTLTMSYAAEVLPLALRGYLIANVNCCWIIGQITSLAVLRALQGMTSQWSYRIPFALQWAWVSQ